MRRCLPFLFALLFLAACSTPPPPRNSYHVAASAPLNVCHAVEVVNQIVGSPYKWGGGHGCFGDYGYDCSGAVSLLLHAAGALSAPSNSDGLARWGIPGRGRWITVYVRPGYHVFATVAGVRLDTTDLGGGGNSGPRWYLTSRSTRGFQARTMPWL